MTDSGIPRRMQLPAPVDAVLFDVDGVVTDTAKVHARAWKETFDAVLQELGDDIPFDADQDYLRYVDGRPRLDGVRTFLLSRDIHLPEGEAADPPDALTINGVGTRKNTRLQEILARDGVDAYPGSLRFLHRVRDRGIGTAVVSSSKNARMALRSVGVEDCFDTWVDGHRVVDDHLAGKPAPDMFLAAANDLNVPPERAVVLEDALAGVAAGRAGNFGCVVGVNRTDQADELRAHGADIVVEDLDELELAP